MSLNLATILRHSATERPDHTALILGDVQLSYRAVHDLAQRFAGALLGLGLRPGQHVALLLPNVPPFTIAYFGAHYAGCPVVPLNVLFRPDEIAYHLDDSDAVALVVWEGLLPQAREGFSRVPACKHLIVARTDPRDLCAPEEAHNLMALLGEAEPVTDLPPTMPDDTAVLLYTSGTTGKPKGAELSHYNMFGNAEYTATGLLDLKDPVALCCLPLFHSFGQTVMHNATLLCGGTVVLMPRFEPEAAFQLMARHRVSFFGGVPTMYFALLGHPSAEAHDLSSLRHCLAGGAPMPVEVMRAFDERYRVNILEGYGLSETSPVASFNVLDRPKKPGSIGVPIRGVEFRLLDADGGLVTEAGAAGEICIKGPNVMKGYYKRPEATREVMDRGWFRTGDIGVRDEDGSYRIVDRKKDMIIRGGFNVYPREVEEVLYAHPAIGEAAVVGVPSASHGEEVKAIVACKAGKSATAEELMGYCREHLAAYKCPRIVEFRDSLPKGPTGKILKRELR